MRTNSEPLDRLMEKLIRDESITLEQFAKYEPREPKFTVAGHGNGFVLVANGVEQTNSYDHLYHFRDTAEAVAKIKNLRLQPPRERGVCADAETAARAYAKLTGFPVKRGRWDDAIATLKSQGKILAAGFGRYRIADDELAKWEKVNEAAEAAEEGAVV